MRVRDVEARVTTLTQKAAINRTAAAINVAMDPSTRTGKCMQVAHRLLLSSSRDFEKEAIKAHRNVCDSSRTAVGKFCSLLPRFSGKCAAYVAACEPVDFYGRQGWFCLQNGGSMKSSD